MEIAEGMTEFTYQGESIPGYLANPASAGFYPGVVLIQEWWGLVPHIKDVAGRLARQGFVALAPDLYHPFPATNGSHVAGRAPANVVRLKRQGLRYTTKPAAPGRPQAGSCRPSRARC